MQYVRSISGSVSKTWNSINPATLSGAIDVIVVEQEDGSLACSPFHVRFGKFSLLRPSEKKVEFRVNDAKQEYAMKLGDGGEAFFVFETLDDIPEALQTSPLISPATSPNATAMGGSTPNLQEPDYLDLTTEEKQTSSVSNAPVMPILPPNRRVQSDIGNLTPLSQSPNDKELRRPQSGDWSGPETVMPKPIPLERSTSDRVLSLPGNLTTTSEDPLKSHIMLSQIEENGSGSNSGTRHRSIGERSNSPPLLSYKEAVDRAKSLSQKLSGSNIPTQVTDTGDLKLDMTGYKSSEDEVLRAEIIARKILAEELEGNYDIGALIGADEQGNLWIYSSEEAKEAAGRKAELQQYGTGPILTGDSASDPGYHSDNEKSAMPPELEAPQHRRDSDAAAAVLMTPPQTPPEKGTAGDPNRNYAKTLRLTSDQLKALQLRSGANSMSFTVNRATCTAYMFYWKHDIPIVISDIDGTITKSDALGHVLNMIGRDWTHLGVAKLYTDIVANGYHILYLTSRSVGQADTTRGYLKGVVQDGHRLPNGPVIMSPDRTYAALRREVYLRKPEVFKMACLRDILHLFTHKHNPFYAGFGNRLTDALSYRSVNIPSTRIFTINSNAEVSLDLLTLNKYKSSYVTMRELVDHFFPPVGLLVTGGGEDFTDFNYWRDQPLALEDFSASESEDDNNESDEDEASVQGEDEVSDIGDDERDENMGDSFMARDSIEADGETLDAMMESSMLDDESRMESSMIESRDGSFDIDESDLTLEDVIAEERNASLSSDRAKVVEDMTPLAEEPPELVEPKSRIPGEEEEKEEEDISSPT